MRINKIKLENIRSYLNQEIVFPEGSVLLSGDIGTGKSSVLLAIDFALFGLRRSELSGASLLRNGKDYGFVELDFDIDGKNVVIKRSLKRDKSVSQDSGYIIINGSKKEGTAVELKQAVLDLLNYPKELLTKSKSLIYRYTVYTPQEEMKQILVGDKDVRLDTLRRVFGIDKYKRIKENTDIFLSKLKEKIKLFEGMVVDLGEKEEIKKKKLEELNKLKIKVNDLIPVLEKFSKDILNKKEEISKIEDDIKILNNLKSELEVVNANLRNKLESRERYNREIDELDKESELLSKDLKGKEIYDGLDDKIKKKENEFNILDEEFKELIKKISEFSREVDLILENKDGILKLDICPLCKQTVDLKYKHSLIKKENEKVEGIKKSMEIHFNKKHLNENEIKKIKEELEILRNKEKESGMIRLKKERLEEKQNRLKYLLKLQSELTKEMERFTLERRNISEKIREYSDIDKKYEINKKELEELRNKEKEVEINKSSLDREIEDFEDELIELSKEINRKLEIKRDVVYFNKLREWVEKYFVNIMGIMEKKIMFKVHNDFNVLFQNWFDILIEDENLNIKLDDEFSPLIIQNDYEIEYNFLSGGEKTAAALAYRLALNQVINRLMDTIKTDDIIILDEPTDGFSSEQLDRMKLVLDELDVKQVVIVSHESKIESFVDNVIKFRKEGHVTSVG